MNIFSKRKTDETHKDFLVRKYGVSCDYNSKKVAIIDTETFGVTEPRIYDFGILIADLKGNVIYKEQFIIDEVFKSNKMKTAFYACKRPLYFERIENGEVTVMPFWQCSKKVNQILKDFNVSIIGAYNLKFDERAMTHSAREYKYMTDFISRYHRYRRLDLWTTAVKHLGTNPKFHEFCLENGFVTSAGNLKTDAETMYRYIVGNPNFREEHVSIDDCQIEYEIFLKVLKAVGGQVEKILDDVQGSPYRFTGYKPSK